MFRRTKYILLLIIVGSAFVGHAQSKRDTLNREVEVTKAYKPRVSDANKLNKMPVIEDSEFKNPQFNYHINSQPVFSTFSVKPLKAAIIETTQPEEKGYGLVRAGLGSTFRPYGEVFFNNVSGKDLLFGIHAKHLSSFSDIKLEGGDKVDAPFMNNEVSIFAKHSSGKYVLSSSLGIDHNSFNYYGYPVTKVPDELLDDNQTISYFDTKQSFTKGTFCIGLHNPKAKIDDRAYGFDFKYHYFGAKTDSREHLADIKVNLQTPLQSGVALLDGEILFTHVSDVASLEDTVTDNSSRIVLSVKPAWYVGDSEANIKLGVNLDFAKTTDEDAELKIAPNIFASWTPVPGLLNIYAGAEGGLISNYYSKIAYENPYVNPEHDVKNSMQKFRGYIGFDGKFSNKTAFKFSGEYSITDNQPLYYLRNIYIADNTGYSCYTNNTFNVLYDDINRLKLNAEILYDSSDKLDFLFSVNYYNYKTDVQDEAWNLPNWDITVSSTYKVTEQLSVTADLFLTGKRKALVEDTNPYINTIGTLKKYNLDAIVDLNLKGNYQLTNRFSVFAQLNNMGFQKYQKWLGYTVQSFNVLAGISYSF